VFPSSASARLVSIVFKRNVRLFGQAFLGQAVLGSRRVARSRRRRGWDVQVEALWEATVARLKGLLGHVWEEAASPFALLTAKDFVLLFCSALGESPSPFNDVNRTPTNIPPSLKPPPPPLFPLLHTRTRTHAGTRAQERVVIL
jgi:hypothetical protein